MRFCTEVRPEVQRVLLDDLRDCPVRERLLDVQVLDVKVPHLTAALVNLEVEGRMLERQASIRREALREARVVADASRKAALAAQKVAQAFALRAGGGGRGGGESGSRLLAGRGAS